MKPNRLPLLLLIVLAVFAASCTGNSTTETPAVDKPVGVVGSGPGDFNLANPAAGLEDLLGYHQHLQTSFEGTINDEQVFSTLTLTHEVVGDPPVQLSWLETDSQPGQFFGRVGSLNYHQPAPEAACYASPVADVDSLQAPAAYQLASLPQLTGAVFANEEDVNGIPARHYTFDEQAIGFAGQAEAEGEVWVAVTGETVLRYQLRLDAPLDLLGPGVKGVQTWFYELTDVNTAAGTLPETCQQLQAEMTVPMMDNAAILWQQPGYMVYQVPGGGVEAALAFYQEQAETLGWAISTPFIYESMTRLTLRPPDDSMVQLTFEAEGENLTVTVQTLAPIPAE